MLHCAVRALASVSVRRTILNGIYGGRNLAACQQLRNYADYRFTKQHEWLCAETGKVGLSSHAQEKLGDIVYVQLPDVGAEFSLGDDCAAVESVKAAADVYAPVDGKVVEHNTELEEEPSLINKSPMEEGWIFRMKIADASQIEALMNEQDYQAFVQKEIEEE